jgi:hypothetical protein
VPQGTRFANRNGPCWMVKWPAVNGKTTDHLF